MARSKANRVFFRSLFIAALAAAWLVGSHLHAHRRYWRTPSDAANGFLVSPYLQLGNAPESGSTETAEILWHTFDDENEAQQGPWSVWIQSSPEAAWTEVAPPPRYRSVAVPGVMAHRVYRSGLTNLAPGKTFAYRISRDGSNRFEAEGKARPKPGEPSRSIILGDFGNGSSAEARVAYRVHTARPDMIFFAGDLVYWRGRIGEYESYFFPFYNAEKASPAVGAPLIRTRLTIAAPGNHDLMANDLDEDPDAQAFFYYWSFPLNGPVQRADAPGSPSVKGTPERLSKFLEAAGPAYPRMANYSVDVGDVHWTVIDLNAYVDWTDPALLAWLEADLAAAKSKPWRMVLAHHPGFQSGKAHCHEQQMRQLAPLFERGGVSVVFAGHVHNYQRSRPLRFEPTRRPNGKFHNGLGDIAGKFTIDRAYDGEKETVPNGVIYLVTGGGGASLHDTTREEQTYNVNDFTVRFIADQHSFTVMDVTPDLLQFQQVSETGAVLDRFVIRRAARELLSDGDHPPLRD